MNITQLLCKCLEQQACGAVFKKLVVARKIAKWNGEALPWEQWSFSNEKLIVARKLIKIKKLEQHKNCSRKQVSAVDSLDFVKFLVLGGHTPGPDFV